MTTTIDLELRVTQLEHIQKENHDLIRSHQEFLENFVERLQKIEELRFKSAEKRYSTHCNNDLMLTIKIGVVLQTLGNVAIKLGISPEEFERLFKESEAEISKARAKRSLEKTDDMEQSDAS